MNYGKMVAKPEKITKTLKSGVVVAHTKYHYQNGDREQIRYYYQGKEMAFLDIDPGERILYFNSKYLKDQSLKEIRSLIRRRANPRKVSEYCNL